ncbi:MAG: magnetosome biogenesis transporter MamH [Sedimenticola sp.]
MNVENHHRNTLYLIAALCMIFMTMILALQPIYLRTVLGISLDDAGVINANIQVLTEVFDLLVIGYLGHLSDLYGRVKVVVWGFVVAGLSALLIPLSLEIGLAVGIGGLAVFYLMRVFMSLGTTAVWPQLAAVTGDFSKRDDRAQLMSKMAFMMAFGATLVYAILMQLPKYIGLLPSMYVIPAVALIGAWLANRSLVDVAEVSENRKIPWREVYRLVRGDQRLRLTFMSAFSSRNDLVLIGLFLMLWFVYFADVLNMSHEEAVARGGTLIGLIGAVILVSIPFWGYFIQRYGRMVAIACGLFLSGVGFVSMAFVVNPYDWGIYIPAFFMAVGQAGTLIAPQVLTIDIAPPAIRGFVLGAFNTVGGIGMIFFVQMGGFLFDWVGPYAPFVFAGIGNLLIMLYAVWLLRTADKPQLQEVDGLVEMTGSRVT